MTQIIHDHRVTLESILPYFVTAFAIGLITACGPLLLFVRQIYRARLRDATAYHVLAREYVDEFRRKWIAEHPDEPPLGTPDIQSLNEWALGGEWTVGDESAALDAAGGSIAYRFEGRDLNLVLAPPEAGGGARFAVVLDDRPPGDDHGLDVDASGEGVVDEPRMYQLVRQRPPIRQRTFEITFLDAGARAYVFTFG